MRRNLGSAIFNDNSVQPRGGAKGRSRLHAGDGNPPPSSSTAASADPAVVRERVRPPPSRTHRGQAPLLGKRRDPDHDRDNPDHDRDDKPGEEDVPDEPDEDDQVQSHEPPPTPANDPGMDIDHVSSEDVLLFSTSRRKTS